jgi:lipoate-protein ligase A
MYGFPGFPAITAHMRLLYHSMPTPEENLALDEALFQLGEEEGVPSLRFWEPSCVFVVLGYTNRAAEEVRLAECRRRSIPVLRRPSGGGTVVQAPGILNYNLVLPIPPSGPLSTITGTNRAVLERNARALARLLDHPVHPEGQTDLAIEGRKISGNAQKRGRHALVFHGTFLLGLDFGLLEDLLPMPSREPEYRRNRPHSLFCRNLHLEASRLAHALQEEWQAVEGLPVPAGRVVKLVAERYVTPGWNFRR